MGLTHNFGISWFNHPHWGLMIETKKKTTFYEVNAGALAVWRQSLAIDGALLFNCMPSVVRNYSGNSLNGFKMTLDQTLENIPDHPVAQDLFPDPNNQVSGKNSNCLIDWSRFLQLNTRVSCEDIVTI